MSELYCERVIVRGMIAASFIVDLERLWEDSALDVEGVLGVLLDVVEEKTLYAPLMKNDLIVARKSGGNVRDAV
jgi:hypothetical protein